jgi:malonate-semialdehyde dehydrogenase (acetylating)/methylmalonate-semialdehyde dehydrogenase
MSDQQHERYYLIGKGIGLDPISGEAPIKLKYHAGGHWKESTTDKYMPCYNPSTGGVIALAPQCTTDEVEDAVQAAVAAFPEWSTTPVSKRVQVLFNMKTLLDEHLDELTVLLAREMGKKYQEAMGDVLKVTEVVEFA